MHHFTDNINDLINFTTCEMWSEWKSYFLNLKCPYFSFHPVSHQLAPINICVAFSTVKNFGCSSTSTVNHLHCCKRDRTVRRTASHRKGNLVKNNILLADMEHYPLKDHFSVWNVDLSVKFASRINSRPNWREVSWITVNHFSYY